MIWPYVLLIYLAVSSIVYWLWMHEPHYGYLDWPYNCFVVLPIIVFSFGYFAITKNVKLVVGFLWAVLGLNFVLALYVLISGTIRGFEAFIWFWAKGFFFSFVVPGYMILFGFLLWIGLRLVFAALRALNAKSSFTDASANFASGLIQGIALGLALDWFLDRRKKED